MFVLQRYEIISNIQNYFKSFLLRGQESNLRHSAYETGGKPFSPQYGVIDEIRTRSILAPQASVLPYEHQSQSQVLDSNQCKRFCRPPPKPTRSTWLVCSLFSSVHEPWTIKFCEQRSLKDSNLYQNIRSVSCYPLHQETKLFPLGFSIMFPTSIFSVFIRIYRFSISVSSPYFIGWTIIIPTATSFLTDETVIPYLFHFFYLFFFHFALV